MNFALLDIDEDVLHLAQAITQDPVHRITSCVNAGVFAETLRPLAPQTTESAHWESLLLENVVDCVIVGRSDHVDLRADKIKKLVQAKVPLIVVHPACEAIVGYEIEMIRRDVGSIVVPYYPGVASRTNRALAATIADGESGQVEQLTFERRMVSRQKSQVLAQLARDAAIVREIVGPIKSIGGIGSLDDRSGAVSLAVQMTSEGGCLVRWSLDPADGDLEGRITLLGRQGKVISTMPAHGHWTTQWSGASERELVDDRASEVQELLVALSSGAGKVPGTVPAWVDVCRAEEVADTIPRCLARGKTIDLYNEEHTEEGAFKGVMAVGGCLILMLGLLALFVVAIVESLQLPLYRFSLWSNWPIYICALFSFFLLLQLLRFVARSRS